MHSMNYNKYTMTCIMCFFKNNLLTVLNHSWCLQVSERGHVSLSTVVKLLKHKVILEGTAVCVFM